MRIVWALFGNDDDGIYGGTEYPQTPWQAVKWWVKNPAHNLMFYILGVVGKPFVRVGRFPKDNFSPVGGWNWCVIKYKWARLPFISYIGKCKFYIGWRERGNFGIKLTRNKP